MLAENRLGRVFQVISSKFLLTVENTGRNGRCWSNRWYRAAVTIAIVVLPLGLRQVLQDGRPITPERIFVEGVCFFDRFSKRLANFADKTTFSETTFDALASH